MSGMDYDRRSQVSSFYGGRKSSDALNADFSPSAPQYGQPQHTRLDSASSFYNADPNPRTSVDVHGGKRGAGYNRMSFIHTGREEPVKGGADEESMLSKDDGWDIYADFNNAGPRYSSAFVSNDSGYRQVPSPSPLKLEENLNSGAPVELVTVPALGPEWKAEELRGMTKAARREEARESFAQKWTAWNRGERGCCGRYGTRRFTVYFVFGLCIVVGIILAFTIPRVPSFAFSNTTPLGNATAPFNETIPTEFSRSPANFSFPAVANIQVNTQGNFIPLHISSMNALVYDLTTGRQVATGHTGSLTLPAKAYPYIQVPLNFSYIASNDSDQTWANWYNACKNPAAITEGSRPRESSVN
ncbi:hypothetical protein BKA93DRAFT_794943 [Sparassis latifolia]